MRLRAVLDTSILLDADRHELLSLARRRLYTPVWSAFIIGEMVRVRTELSLKHGLDPSVLRRVLERARLSSAGPVCGRRVRDTAAVHIHYLC
jgi:hypothetical protein